MKRNGCVSKLIGNPDSKYTYKPEQLEIDVGTKILEHEECKQKIKEIVLANPSKMELRYHDVIDALRELKEEYGL